MKTTIKSLILICTLGFVGFAASATNNSSINKAGNAGQFILNQDVDAAIDFQREAQILTRFTADREEARAIQKLMDENVLALNIESRSLRSHSPHENMEHQKFHLNENPNFMINLREEAQMLTKLTADREEARVIQKLVEEGKLVENR